jgi:hypothetical protein
MLLLLPLPLPLLLLPLPLPLLLLLLLLQLLLRLLLLLPPWRRSCNVVQCGAAAERNLGAGEFVHAVHTSELPSACKHGLSMFCI